MAHASASALRRSQKLNTPRFSAFLVIVPAAIVVSGLLFSFPHLQAGGAGLSFLGIKRPTPVQKYVCPSTSYTSTFDGLLKNGIPANTAQTLADANARLLGQTDPSKDTATNRADLTARKTALLNLMATDPEIAFKAVLSPNIGDAYQQWTTNCVEERTTVTGKVTLYQASLAKGLTQKGPEAMLTVQTATGSTVVLHPVGTAHTAFTTGDTVTVTGFQLDDRLLFDASVAQVPPQNDTATGYTLTKGATNRDTLTGPQETIVLLVNFQNTAQPSLTVSGAQSVVFGQTNTYYQQNSYNHISIVGDVQNYRTIPLNQSCDAIGSTSAILQAFDDVVDFTQYDRFLVYAPFGPSCAFSGISTVGQGTYSTNDGIATMSVSYVLSSYAGLSVTAHELGHGLGVKHSNFYDCGTVAWAPTGCNEVEYGDPFSIMGNAYNNGYFNALEKDFFQWLSPQQIQTVTDDGNFTLYPIGSGANNLKAIKVQRSADDYLYVEFRQPIAGDAGLPASGFSGALLHVRGGNTFNKLENQAFLIDAKPRGSALNAALPVGSTFVDPLTNTSIKTLSQGDGDLTVQIHIGKHDFTSPQVSITSPAPGSTVSGNFTVTVDAQDASGIEKVVLQNGSLLKGDLGTDFEAPYEFVVDSTMFPAGNAALIAIAYDKSGTPYGVENNTANSGFFSFVVVGGDTIPPTTSMTAPLDNTAVRNLVTVSAQADDNGFISQLKLYVDGVQKFFQFGDASSISGVLDLTQGTHTAYSVVIDQAGLSTQSATSTFVVDNTPPVVTLVDPTQGATVSASIAVSASATDNDAIQKVVFIRDGGTVIGEDTTAPYAYTWDTSIVSPGNHQLGAVAYDRAGNTTTSSTHTVTVLAIPSYLCGDADGTNLLTISDAVYLINYVFSGGPAPVPLIAADADGSGMVTISDAVYLINYVFGGGPAPSCTAAPPSVKLAPDPTEGQTLQSFKAAHPEIFSQ